MARLITIKRKHFGEIFEEIKKTAKNSNVPMNSHIRRTPHVSPHKIKCMVLVDEWGKTGLFEL